MWVVTAVAEGSRRALRVPEPCPARGGTGRTGSWGLTLRARSALGPGDAHGARWRWSTWRGPVFTAWPLGHLPRSGPWNGQRLSGWGQLGVLYPSVTDPPENPWTPRLGGASQAGPTPPTLQREGPLAHARLLGPCPR